MSVEIIIGDALTELRRLPADSVDMCCTSPPYWGLRDYGTGEWQGGDHECQHRSPTMRGDRNEDRAKLAGSDATNMAQLLLAQRSACGKCGAVKVDHQLGLEPNWQTHVEVMADLFEEVRRVLKPAGTLWLNYGDSYATSVNGRSAADTKATGNDDRTFRDKPFSTVQGVLKPKDLCGIPWRVAFALQERGWWLRQDIIWSKPNPMPESITDRCTKAHEYLFLLAKRERYYFDAEAIAEPIAAASIARLSQDVDAQAASLRVPGKTNGPMKAVSRTSGNKTRKPGVARGCPEGTGSNVCGSVPWEGSTRNKRSVWTVATQPFSEAHFATFPPELIEPCIKAGCPVGGTVLDPFGGAGTTGLVADRLQRNAILIELNPEYAAMARRRIDNDRGSLLDAMEAA